MGVLLTMPAAADTRQRRWVVVLEQDAVIRTFIADAIRRHHDVVEATDMLSLVALVTGGARVDVVVGCFIARSAGSLEISARIAHELYEHFPWIPVVLVSDTAPVRLRADVLLTGVRAFVPSDVEPVALARVVARVGRRPDAAIPTSASLGAIKRTLAVLEQASDVPALPALPATMAMSRSHFSRAFHAVAGMPLRNYVRDLRLKRAHALMRSSRLSLTSIAAEVGFYDMPHFNKAFRRRLGMSPTEFRLASVRSDRSPGSHPIKRRH